MLIKYDVTIEDLVAFNRYHCAHSPTVKKSKRTFVIYLPALLVFIAAFVSPTEEVSRSVLVAITVVIAGALSIFFNYSLTSALDRQARRLYKEGESKGLLGQHEVEIDNNGFVERTEVNETRQLWQGVEKIVETNEYAFIYISSMLAHVIPKLSITAGDPEAFIARAKQLWLAADPDAHAKLNA